MFTHRKRLAAAAGALTLGAVLGLTGATPATAGDGRNISPGSTVCTDLVRSDRGIYIYGYATVATTASPIWSVRTSATAGGPETEILRLPTQEPISTNLSWSGTLFYRVCVVQATTVTARGVKIRVNVPPIGNPVYGVGPHTATLGAGGSFCGEFGVAQARATGTSTVPVRWTAPVQNGDGEHLRTIDLGTSTAVNRVLSLGADEIASVCVQNTATSTATLSFDLVAAG
jgi:hypothetical protein